MKKKKSNLCFNHFCKIRIQHMNIFDENLMDAAFESVNCYNHSVQKLTIPSKTEDTQL